MTTDKDREDARTILGKLIQDGRPMDYFLSEEITRIRSEAAEEAARKERERCKQRLCYAACDQKGPCGDKCSEWLAIDSNEYDAWTSQHAILTPESASEKED